MKKFYFNIVLLVICVIAVSSCAGGKTTTTSVPQVLNINFGLVKDIPSNKYLGLDYGIRLNIQDSRASLEVLRKYDASAVYKPRVQSSPDVKSFVSESVRRYMRTMGFNLDADVLTDYMLTVAIKEFNLSYLTGIGWSAVVTLDIVAHDHNRQVVYPNVSAVGRAIMSGNPKSEMLAEKCLNLAYANALEDVDWDRIAFFLKRSSNPAQEGNKVVSGEGNTALENTIIRWYIDSSPKGADVSMRVVSSTSSVKNTNQNYVGSTPYETTEAFDIKGLTYNNSGDVQIEITCEKAGYITQKKRFNLRQAIDQKEISTKFNLVKDE